MCEEHEDERINIYCLRCEAPTCSLCKVFGAHKDCEVAPLPAVYQRQKVGGPWGLGGPEVPTQPPSPSPLPAERAQRWHRHAGGGERPHPGHHHADGGDLPHHRGGHRAAALGLWRLQEQPLTPVPQENGRRQKQHVGLRFDALYGILEERKKELLQSIAAEQEAKLQRVRGLIRQYGDHLEASSKLVESAIQAMEEPQMAVYLQVLPGEQGEEGTGPGAALGL